MALSARQVFKGVPASDTHTPDPQQIVDLFDDVYGTIDQRVSGAESGLQVQINELESSVMAASSGVRQAATWIDLSAIVGTTIGQAGRVAGPDSGTHVDPVTGETVGNEGEYAWSTAPAGWRRVGELLISKKGVVAADFIDELGFVGARLGADGVFDFNERAKSFVLDDTASADEHLSVSDSLGFKVLSLTSTEFRVPSVTTADGEEIFNEDFDAQPLIGGHLVGFAGRDTHIFARNLFPQRSDLSRVRATLYSEAAVDGTRAAYLRTGDDDLVIDLGKCGPASMLQVRRSEVDTDLRQEVELATIAVPIDPPVGGTAANVLMIGDSITNRQMAARMQVAADASGYSLTFVGTINGAGIGQFASDATGPLNEGREGWEFGDFTYAVIDRVSEIAIGDEAAYLASAKDVKWPQNPFIRAAVVEDNPAYVRNGKIFDYGFYLTRFALAAPDVVCIGLGTNDVRDRDDSELQSVITDGLTIMCDQILTAQPSTQIVIWLPPVSRSNNRDGLWSEYVIVLSKLLQFVRDRADNRTILVPAWAMASQEVGFPLNAGTVTENGVQVASLSDTVHLGPLNIALVAEILAAAAAAKAQSLI